MNKLKFFATLALFSVLSYSTCVLAGTWEQDGSYWKYVENGAPVVSSWKLIKNNDDYYNYYFDEFGHMATGIWKIDNEYYSFNADGSTNSKGKVNICGEEFETENKGLIYSYPTDLAQDSFKGHWETVGNKYKFNVNGNYVVSNWRLIYSSQKLDWYYFDEFGYMVTGVWKIGDEYYSFNNDGTVNQNNKVKIDDVDYETEIKGVITSYPSTCFQDSFHGNWEVVADKRKFNVNGVYVVSNWRLIYENNSLNWYYFDQNGLTLKGLQKLPDNVIYYFNDNGSTKSHNNVALPVVNVIQTVEKGKVVNLGQGFNYDEYLMQVKAEEEAASIEAENLKLFQQQFTVAPAETAAQNVAPETSASTESKKLKVKSTKKENLKVDGEDDAKIKVKYSRPYLEGPNAEAVNKLIKDNLKDIIYTEVESRYGMTSSDMEIDLTSVDYSHDVKDNMIYLRYNGDFYLVVYVNLSSMEIYTG